jgi:two-component system sensor histidine kinase/response regulator
MLALCLDLFYIISFNYMNGLVSLPNIHNVDSPELRLISIITAFIIFSSLFFYYKKLIIEQNLILDQTNKDLSAKNEELNEVNATKDKFFSIIAHDLRGPLNSIHGFAELLQTNHKTFDECELESFAKVFYNTSENTCKTVENLLSWSHSQLNSLQVNSTTIQLHRFISDEIEIQKELANAKEIQINNFINQNIVVEADSDIARVVFRNLITNAIKFSYRNSTISILANKVKEGGEDFIEICVSDTGIGMESESCSKLFKVENVNSNPGTEDEIGTGLGLILCKEFAEKNGGKIYVNSKKGKGSDFYFTLLSK